MSIFVPIEQKCTKLYQRIIKYTYYIIIVNSFGICEYTTDNQQLMCCEYNLKSFAILMLNINYKYKPLKSITVSITARIVHSFDTHPWSTSGMQMNSSIKMSKFRLKEKRTYVEKISIRRDFDFVIQLFVYIPDDDHGCVSKL